MIKLKTKRKISKRKRNPPPLFFKEINELIDHEVLVQFGSEDGSFGIKGILIKEGTNYKVEIEDPKLRANIVFNIKLIQQIVNKNIIILYSLPENLKRDLNINNDPTLAIGKWVRIAINHFFWDEFGMFPPLVTGILHYDKKQKMFYIAKLNKMWLRFNEDGILSVMQLGVSYTFDIQI